MKALVYDQYTIDDNFSQILKIKDIPSPELKSGEVVFKVKVAALNYDDIWGNEGQNHWQFHCHISLELML